MPRILLTLAAGTGLRVKEVAREKGISMGKLHSQADVLYKTIKRIYSDPFNATTTIALGKLAKALGVPPGDRIEEVPDKDVSSSILKGGSQLSFSM